ncbi:putative tetratricopeptide-like helical domain superfamily [Dioscorea sansibarensis]
MQLRVRSSKKISRVAAVPTYYSASKLFDQIPQPRTLPFLALNASAYAKQNPPGNAFSRLRWKLASGMRPTSFTFVPVLSSLLLDLRQGIQLHSLILKTGLLYSEPFSSTALLDFWARNGHFDYALKLFDEIPHRTVVTWNSLISRFSQHGFAKSAIIMFRDLLRSDIRPSECSFIGILSAFGSSEISENCSLCCFKLEYQMHGLMIKTSMDSYIVALNALMNVYSNWSSVCVVERLFSKSPVRDVVTWNTMMATFVKSGAPKKALVHFLVMLFEGPLPNESTFTSAVGACADLGTPEYGQFIHAKAIKYNLSTGVYLGSSLVSFYARCQNLNNAYKIFSEIPDKNVVCWNALISGCSNEVTGASVALLKEMLLSGILPNEFTFSSGLKRNSIIELTQIHSLITKMGHDSNKYVMSSVIASYDAHGIILDVSSSDKTSVISSHSLPRNAIAGIYNRQGRFNETKQLLSQIQYRDAISWNILLTACARNQDYSEAFQIFKQMQSEGFLMDNYTAVSLLSICSKINRLDLGSALHAFIIKVNSGYYEVFVNNVLLDMYTKCGSLDCAFRVFEEMDERNLISWTALISGLGLHGCIHEALERFKQMELEGFKPDSVTFMAVLSGCRHNGLVEEGMWLFNHMRSVYAIEPDMDHYVAVLDLLCRHGHIKEAESVVSSMPFQPNAVIWRIFLQGCKRYGNML